MDPHTGGTEGPAADRGSALRIPQDSVARGRIDPVDALASGTTGLALYAIEAFPVYADTTESVFACYPRDGSVDAGERFGLIGPGFACVALRERSRHHEAGSGSPRLAQQPPPADPTFFEFLRRLGTFRIWRLVAAASAVAESSPCSSRCAS